MIIQKLPTDWRRYMISFFEVDSVVTATKVSKEFKKIFNDREIWKKIAERFHLQVNVNALLHPKREVCDHLHKLNTKAIAFLFKNVPTIDIDIYADVLAPTKKCTFERHATLKEIVVQWRTELETSLNNEFPVYPLDSLAPNWQYVTSYTQQLLTSDDFWKLDQFRFFVENGVKPSRSAITLLCDLAIKIKEKLNYLKAGERARFNPKEIITLEQSLSRLDKLFELIKKVGISKKASTLEINTCIKFVKVFASCDLLDLLYKSDIDLFREEWLKIAIQLRCEEAIVWLLKTEAEKVTKTIEEYTEGNVQLVTADVRQSILDYVCKSKDLKPFELLLKKGLKFNYDWLNGAVKLKSIEAVEWLLQHVRSTPFTVEYAKNMSKDSEVGAAIYEKVHAAYLKTA